VKNIGLKTLKEEITWNSWTRWENSVRMCSRETGYEDMDWIYGAQDRYQ
jgi:hypothetical protein